MKSTTMLAELQQAHAERAKLDSEYLEMFIRLGSANVRSRIVDMMIACSTATSMLGRDALFALLFQQVRESINQVDSDAFRDTGCLFLSKLYGYKLSEEQRHKILQEFIDLITRSASSMSSGFALVRREHVLKQLLVHFPEVLHDKTYRLSPQFRECLFEILHRYDAWQPKYGKK